MRSQHSFYFFHFIARFFGSLFFPMFSAFGENEFKTSGQKVVFARNYGFISLLNLLRFFRTPVRIIARAEECNSLPWKAAIAGGLDLRLTSENCSIERLQTLLSEAHYEKVVPVLLLSHDNQDVEKAVISDTAPENALFLAMSGCNDSMSLGFIPIVHDMKVLCAGIPAYGYQTSYFTGIQSLEFLEHSLALTPQFELPTLFFTHRKFSSLS